MKVFVKSLKGNHFQIEVQPQHTVSDVKKNIESVQGANVFPASQQMLIYQGRALSDGTTLEENKVTENSFIVVMLCKSKNSSRESSVAAAAIPTPKTKSLSGEGATVAVAATPTYKNTGESSVAAAAVPTSKSESSPKGSSVVESSMPTSKSKSSLGKGPVGEPTMPIVKSKVVQWKQPLCTSMAPATPESPSVEASSAPPTPVTNASVPASMPIPVSVPVNASSISETDVSYQAASNFGAGNDLESTIQHILDMGGGIWDRSTVERALHAASNDPDRAVEFLYAGVPEQAEAGKPMDPSAASQLPTRSTTIRPNISNADPLNSFPRGLSNLESDASPLDFLRHSEQFQALRAMVQANPQTMQPMIQEFGKQNPNLMRLIQEYQADFQRLLNEPVQGEEGNILERFASAVPQAVQVTPKEHASIERLEAMGFDRSTVLEDYFACNKNEELTANYLLDHMHEF